MGEKTYCWDGHSISNLLQDRTGRSQSGRGNILTNVVVDHDGCNNVEDNLEGLQQDQSFGEISRLLHLSNKTEESHMGTVGKDNVGDSAEGLEQTGVDGSLEVPTTLKLDTHCDHSDDDGSEDTEEGYMKKKKKN